MTREDAIKELQESLDTLREYNIAHSSRLKQALEMAIRTLENHDVFMKRAYSQGKQDALSQEPCDDAISRDAVLNAICDYVALGEFADKSHTFTVRPLEKRINDLPSVTQKSKTGHWISYYDEDAKAYWYECDRCHTERAFNTDYCPDCGCRMVEPQESEVEE